VKRMVLLVGLTVLGLACPLASAGTYVEEAIFNGKDLTGWDGDPRLWSVVDGAIRGQTTEENPARENTFCIWRGGMLKNFVLKIKFRIENGNSGIQYRSKDLGSWRVGGYQAEVENNPGKVGFLYDERGRGWMVNVGDFMVVDEKGNKDVVSKVADRDGLIKAGYYKDKDWNEYTIIARGNHLVHILNGYQTVEMIDNDPKGRALEGILALQIHTGPPMVAEFKDIRVAHLPDHFGEARLLFDGKSLEGWTLSSDELKETWKVAEGVLVNSGSPAGYIRTKKDFTNFVLRLQFRHLDRGNGGVLVRMVGDDKVWPRSIEAQGEYGSVGDIWNIDEFPMKTDPQRTSGRHTRKMHDSNEKPLGEWNQYEIALDGGDLEIEVNELVQNTATECWETPGKICLQSEGAPMEFRNIVLVPIRPPESLQGPPAALPTEFERMLPEDVVLYVSVPDAAGTVKTFKESNTYKILRDIDLLHLMSAQPDFERFKQGYNAIIQPLTEIFHKRIALAVKDIRTGGGPPGLIVLADVCGKEELLRQYLADRVDPLLEARGAQRATFTQNGIEVRAFSFAGPKALAVCYAIVDDVFVGAIGRQNIEGVLDSLKRERSLASNPLFQEVRQKVGEASDFFVYGNLSPLWEMKSASLVQARKERPVEGLAGALGQSIGVGIAREMNAILTASGLTDVKAVGFSLQARGSAAKQTLFLATGPERKGFVKLLARKSSPLKAARYLPEDTTLFWEFSVGDFGEFWDELLGVIGDIARAAGEEGDWQQKLEKLKAWEGRHELKIKEEILAPFAGEVCLAVKMPEVLGVPPVFLLVEVRDAQKATALMESKVAALEKALGSPVVKFTENYKGVTITSVTLLPPGSSGLALFVAPFLRPAYAVVGDFLVLGVHSNVVKKVVDAHQGGKSLQSRPEFKNLMANLAEQGCGTSYLDVKDLYDFLYSTFGALAARQIGSEMVAKLGRIRECLGSAASRLSCDDRGITCEAFSDSGLAEMAIVLMAEAALLPKFFRAKEEGPRAACLNNLRILSVGCMMYANDHDGLLPAKLSELYPNYAAGLNLFACPAHNAKEIARGNIDDQSDYKLEIPGAKLGEVKDPARTIMISEKEANHRGGRNAAYADGHVEFIPGGKTEPAAPLRAIRTLAPGIAM